MALLCLNSICEYLRSLAHSNCVNFFRVNQAALRAVLKLENMLSSAQTMTQIPVRFVCVCVCVCALQVRFLSSPFAIVSVAAWITVFVRFDCSMFESISIDYKTLELIGAKLFCI